MVELLSGVGSERYAVEHERGMGARVALLPREKDRVADRVDAADVVGHEREWEGAQSVVDRQALRDPAAGVERQSVTRGIPWFARLLIVAISDSVVCGLISAEKLTNASVGGGCCVAIKPSVQ